MYDFVKYEKTDKPYKFLTLSFDDGVTQDKRFIELLNKYNLKCTFNLNSGTFGRKDVLSVGDTTVNHFKVEASEVKELYKGHEVAVHSLTHPRLDLLDREGLIRELVGDKNNLEDLTDQKVIGMAYPGGPYYNDLVFDVIQNDAGLIYSREVEPTLNFELPSDLILWHPTCHIQHEKAFELAKQFKELKPEQDSLFYIWGHTYEFDIKDTWDEVERFLEYISGDDSITYATNGEIAKYILKNK